MHWSRKELEKLEKEILEHFGADELDKHMEYAQKYPVSFACRLELQKVQKQIELVEKLLKNSLPTQNYNRHYKKYSHKRYNKR